MIDADNLNSEQETDQDTPEVQTRARDMGWKPESEWKGKPPRDGFLSASEYTRRADKIMPIVRAENAKLKDELAKARSEREADREEHKKTIGRIERMSTLALDQQRQQIESKYADRIDAAAEVGDKAAVQQARKEEKEALAAIDEKLKEPVVEDKDGKERKGLPREVEDIVNAWRADQPWYTDDPDNEMAAFANSRHMKLQKEKKGLSLKENLEQVAADVRKRFPEEFGDDKPDDDDEEKPRGSRVEGGSRNGGNGGNKSAWSKVPPEARKIAQDAGHLEYFLKSGETLEKNGVQAKERWADKYLEGDAR